MTSVSESSKADQMEGGGSDNKTTNPLNKEGDRWDGYAPKRMDRPGGVAMHKKGETSGNMRAVKHLEGG